MVLSNEKQAIEARLDGYEIAVHAALFSADGKQLVTAHAGLNGLHVWEAGSWRLLKKIPPAEGRHLHGSATFMQFTRDGRHLLLVDGATVKEPVQIRIYETTEWTIAGSLAVQDSECALTALSKDGSTFAGTGGGIKKSTVVWDISTLGK